MALHRTLVTGVGWPVSPQSGRADRRRVDRRRVDRLFLEPRVRRGRARVSRGWQGRRLSPVILAPPAPDTHTHFSTFAFESRSWELRHVPVLTSTRVQRGVDKRSSRSMSRLRWQPAHWASCGLRSAHLLKRPRRPGHLVFSAGGPVWPVPGWGDSSECVYVGKTLGCFVLVVC